MKDKELLPNEWVYGPTMLSTISANFQLSRNLCGHFADSEQVIFELSAWNIAGRWLFFECDAYGPCKAPDIKRRIELPATEFKTQAIGLFSKTGADICNLFCRDGRHFNPSDVATFQNQAGNISF